MGITRFGVDEGLPQGLASHDGMLYMLGDANDALYRLNPNTGEAERVGSAAQFGQNRGDPDRVGFPR